MILRQYDPKASQKMPKSAMTDRFIQLNISDESLRDDGPCLAIVPYAADCGDRAADFSNQIVDFQKSNRKMIKIRNKEDYQVLDLNGIMGSLQYHGHTICDV